MARKTDLGGALTGLALLGGGVWLLSKFFPSESVESRIRRFVVGRVHRAASILGVGAPPVVETRLVSAAASDGRRLLYNHDWVVTALKRYCRDGHCEDQVVIGVVAHELAHHGLGHAFDGAARPHENELDADYNAGRVLAVLGLGSGNFESVLFAESLWPTATHPAGHDRVAAVRQGYESVATPTPDWMA